MTTARLRWHLPILAVLVCSACGPAPRAASDGLEARSVPEGLDELRTATRRFASLDSAAAAGYRRDVADCLVHEHHGAMGYHHTNADYMDRDVDVRRPEILLYERLADGGYRLNGVEFIVPYRAWPRDSVAPQVLGEPMRREDNLKFWYLHVWAWKPNPDGLFSDFHPDVQCSAESRKVFRPSGG